MTLPNSVGALVNAESSAPQTPAPAAPVPGEGNDGATDANGIPKSVGAAPDAATTPRTAEEVDQFWRNRVAQKDRAHADAERALRAEIESLKSAPPPAAGNGATSSSGTQGQPDPRISELERQLTEEKAARLVDQRKAKYPHLAAQVGQADAIFASADEATLAKLNALADDSDGGGTLIAPTSPKRAPATATKPLHEKSKEELEADLKAASPGYEAWARARQG